MNRIIKKSILLELPETLESGNAKIICDRPYVIERTEEFGVIIWWGYGCNWKFVDGKWYELVHNEFIECEIPEYELIYQGLNNDSYTEK